MEHSTMPTEIGAFEAKTKFSELLRNASFSKQTYPF